MIIQLKDNFFQIATSLWAGAYRTYQPRKLGQPQFPLKYLKLVLVTLFSITPNETKQVNVQQKNTNLEQSETLFERWKGNRKPKPLL